MSDPGAILYQVSIWLLPVLFAITVHEAAHGWMAERRGDDTARRLGRVTLNPIPHVDPVGTVVLPAILLLFGSPFLFGWAKPVPVMFHRLHHPKRDMVWVALAGPVSNILMAMTAALALHAHGAEASWLSLNLVNAMSINVSLAVFNMLPVLPLDGGRVLTGLLPVPLAIRFARTERFGILLVLGLIVIVPMVAGELGYDFNPLADLLQRVVLAVYRVLLLVTGWGSGV